MDAGEMRGRLAVRLSEMLAAGFVRPAVLEQFEREVSRLAALTGLSRDVVRADLRSDAESLGY